VLFQIPSSQDPTCLNGPTVAQCYKTVMDLGAIDIQRGRDHGLGTYNQLRAAYGLPAKNAFTDITGENTDAFPAGSDINNPNINDVVALFDIDGKALDVANPASNPSKVVKRTTLAARLKGVYGSTANVDAFVGAFSEPHVAGTEFGETNLAVWTKQFTALRDGDRFFFENDLGTLNNIKSTYGIDFRTTLSQLIARNTDAKTAADIHDNFFLTAEDDLPATTCSVNYSIAPVDGVFFDATIKITNDTDTLINGWTLFFGWNQGQSVVADVGADFDQSGQNGQIVAATANSVFTAVIEPHTSETVAVRAQYDGQLNAIPPNFKLTSAVGTLKRCASNHH
jgi:hypothetical protein